MGEPTSLTKHDGASWSSEQFADAVERLDHHAWQRLRRVARAYAIGGQLEPDDLLQVTCQRVLDGTRVWPQEVDLVHFLAETMKSIAHAMRAWTARSPMRRPTSLYDATGRLVADRPDERPNPEAEAAEREEEARMRLKITEIFADDFIAQILVEGIMEGMRGEELRDLASLNPTEFASKRKLINRRLQGLQAKGGLS